MDRVGFGDFDLIWLSDGHYYLDGGAMFGVVPKPLWERKLPADERNRVPLGLNSLLIRTGAHNVLVETGLGNKLPEKVRQIHQNEEKLLESFAAARIDPTDIDIVINTHLHFDHCGWNTVRQGDRVVATFPKARYYAQAGEVEHAHHQYERDRVSYISENYDPLIENGQMHLIHGDQEIVPGVSVRVYPGHTRNMQAVLIQSAGRTACYISDLIPTRAHLDRTWVMAYDLFPLETIENRKRFYQEAIPEEWLVFFTHDASDPWAYVEAGEKGKYRSRPVGGELSQTTGARSANREGQP